MENRGPAILVLILAMSGLPVQSGLAELGLVGSGLVESGLVEIGLLELGLAELGLAELGLAELRLVGSGRVRVVRDRISGNRNLVKKCNRTP